MPTLAKHLLKILSPVVGSTNSFVKNSEHLISKIKKVELQQNDALASFNIVSLFTNVPVDEVMSAV
jgi:hypothetical protein